MRNIFIRTRKLNERFRYRIYGWTRKSPARYKQIEKAMRLKFWGIPNKWTRNMEE